MVKNERHQQVVRVLKHLFWVLEIGFITPLVSLSLASLVFHKTNTVGPFLLASPLLALSIVSLIFMEIGGRKEGELTEQDPELREMSTRLGEKFNMFRNLNVLRCKGAAPPGCAVYVSARRITVYDEAWEPLHPEHREFAFATAYCEAVLGERVWIWNKAVSTTAAIVLGMIASQNLWLIIPIHSLSAVTAVFLLKEVANRTKLAADRMAISVTKNIAAAKVLIHALGGQGSPWSDSRRIAALDRLAVEETGK